MVVASFVQTGTQQDLSAQAVASVQENAGGRSRVFLHPLGEAW